MMVGKCDMVSMDIQQRCRHLKQHGREVVVWLLFGVGVVDRLSNWRMHVRVYSLGTVFVSLCSPFAIVVQALFTNKDCSLICVADF